MQTGNPKVRGAIEWVADHRGPNTVPTWPPAWLRRAERTAGEQARRLVELTRRHDADFVEALAEAWEERVSICTADGIPVDWAERTALEQVRRMASGKPWNPDKAARR